MEPRTMDETTQHCGCETMCLLSIYERVVGLGLRFFSRSSSQHDVRSTPVELLGAGGYHITGSNAHQSSTLRQGTALSFRLRGNPSGLPEGQHNVEVFKVFILVVVVVRTQRMHL